MRPWTLRALLEAVWQPRHMQPPGPIDDLVVTAALYFRRALNELARLKRAVAAQAADGRFVGNGHLTTDAIQGLTVQSPCESGDADLGSWPCPLNATASSPTDCCCSL